MTLVNSENLLPLPQKYNAGSLRIPADPSWPKIPQRKSISGTVDILEPPYVVTLKGSPRRSNTVVRTSPNQSAKPTKDAYNPLLQQRAASSVHITKRLPGSVDPRFKKVMNLKKSPATSEQERDTPKEIRDDFSVPEKSCTVEPEKSIPERDINTKQNRQQVTTQEAEKPDETRNTENSNAQRDFSSRTIPDTKPYLNSNKIQDSKEQTALNNQDLVSEQHNLRISSEFNDPNSLSESVGKDDDEKKNSADNTCSYHQQNVDLKSSMIGASSQAETAPFTMQESNRQLFFVVEKKLQSQPMNAIQVETITLPQECTKQCYNMQVPILTYQNIPVEISSEGRCTVTQQCLNNSKVSRNETAFMNGTKEIEACPVESIRADLIPKFLQNVSSNADETFSWGDGRKNIESNCDNERKNVTQRMEGKEYCFNKDTGNNRNPIIPEKLGNVQRKQESSDSEYYLPNAKEQNACSVLQHSKLKKIPHNTTVEETTDFEDLARNTVQEKFDDFKLFVRKFKKPDMEIAQSGKFCPSKQENNCEPQLNFAINEKRPCEECKTLFHTEKLKNKSELNLPSVKNECARKLLRNSEPHITIKQRNVSVKLSKNAKSHFQRNSHSALIDSDYTIWPNSQHVKCNKRNQQNVQRLGKTKRIRRRCNAKLSAQSWSKSVQDRNNFHFFQNSVRSPREEVNSLSEACLQKKHIKDEFSPRTNTEEINDVSKGIPLKTQELLNKSYWEYYNKLRHNVNPGSAGQKYVCQLTTDAPDTKKRKCNELEDKELKSQTKLNPELQTLRQCSALSSMINKTLDPALQSLGTSETKELNLNGNTKTSTDPTAVTNHVTAKKMMSNSEEYNDDTLTSMFAIKTKRKRDKRGDKQFLEFKTISKRSVELTVFRSCRGARVQSLFEFLVFFGSMMYILIIFLPMLYDYFYHEEYDEYESLSYLEILLEYILSSFKEAFGGIFDGARKVLFYSRSCKKCNSAA